MSSNRLGDALLKSGKVNQDQLREGLALQKEKGGRIGSALVKIGALTEKELVEFLSKHFAVPAIDLARVDIDEGVIKVIPADVARKYTILPIAKVGAKITLAMIDPTIERHHRQGAQAAFALTAVGNHLDAGLRQSVEQRAIARHYNFHAVARNGDDKVLGREGAGRAECLPAQIGDRAAGRDP